MDIIQFVSITTTVVFTAMYGYLFLYVIIGLVSRRRLNSLKAQGLLNEENPELHKFAFIVCARNESAVIANLIDSMKKQDYPDDLYDIYVVADNCTDNTAEVAREAGAIVFERFNDKKVAKSYALNHAFQNIKELHGSYDYYDFYCIFDADNIISKGYAKAMNKEFSKGFLAVQGFRNSKNYGDNWITAGYSVSFIRESSYINFSRKSVGLSSMVGGTGFLISSKIIEQNDGWYYNLLTEDIEFSADLISKNITIGYSPDAIYYDEQPTSFSQSFRQRLRWTRGFFQVTFKYGGNLIVNIFKNMFKNPKKSLSSLDCLMTLAPTTLISLTSAVIIAICVTINATQSSEAAASLVPNGIQGAFAFCVQYYFINFLFGLVSVVTEWNKIICTNTKKILYLFTYPLFMLTYVPMPFIALFTGNKWRPIKHTKSRSLDELENAMG